MADVAEGVVTSWSCNGCGRAGEVTVTDGAGVYEALHIIEDAHAEKSPDCSIDVGFVHVGRHYWTGGEYGDVWECDPDCPHPDHATEDTDA